MHIMSAVVWMPACFLVGMRPSYRVRHMDDDSGGPRPPPNIVWARAATESVHGLLGGATNSGHRNRDVIATALKDLPHANRNA